MDNVSINIKYIQEQKNNYIEYLNEKLGTRILEFIKEFSRTAEILIFSGITRDFFLRKHSHIVRDLDLVVNCHKESLDNFLEKYNYIQNSFGGYKIIINDLYIDIWMLEDTWAFKNSKINAELFKNYSLPDTVFFNFSSIVYNYNNQEFIVTSDFLDFLKTKKIDLVLEDNPLPELCIVNSIYYKNKFNLELSEHLKEYIVNNFHRYSKEDFYEIQMKHFKSELYNYGVLKVYYEIIKNSIRKK